MLATACFCTKVRRSSRILLRLYDEALAPSGLTTMQFAALRSIDRMGAPGLTELAQATGYERSAMWRTLQPLAAEGLVTLSGTPRKAGPVALTAAGRARIEQVLPRWTAAQARVEAAIGPHAQALFQALDEVEALA